MPDYEMSTKITSLGRTIKIHACDPECYDEVVETCTTRIKIDGRSDTELYDEDEIAIDRWLQEEYYPWVLDCMLQDGVDDAAEAAFESREAYAECFGPGDADYR